MCVRGCYKQIVQLHQWLCEDTFCCTNTNDSQGAAPSLVVRKLKCPLCAYHMSENSHIDPRCVSREVTSFETLSRMQLVWPLLWVA